MKQIPPALASDLRAGVTTLAHLWRVHRKDGVIIRLTDHDQDILYDERIDFVPGSIVTQGPGSGTGVPGSGSPGGGNTQGTGTPDFQDLFDGTSLDTSKWVPTNTTYANYVGAGSDVTFDPANLDFQSGVLRLKITQPTASTSTGVELVSVNRYGYGTYEWSIRAASTSITPNGVGAAVSGQISTGFTFYNNSETEIDCPEIEGRLPKNLEFTNWNVIPNKQFSQIVASFNPQDAFHLYKFVWGPGQIDFYVDNVLVATHNSNIPSSDAYILISVYGTNSNTFGGLATVGVTRYMYVDSFKFWTAGNATTTPHDATITWRSVATATSYNVKRGDVSGGPYTTIANVSGTTYVDTTVVSGNTYYYVISAVNSFGESGNSSEVVAIIP